MELFSTTNIIQTFHLIFASKVHGHSQLRVWHRILGMMLLIFLLRNSKFIVPILATCIGVVIKHNFLNFELCIRIYIPWYNRKTFYFLSFFILPSFTPYHGQKNDFLPIWAMWYQFRHVWKGQMTYVSELKPYFHNNEDPWKNWHFKYWNCPHCNHNNQILAKKSIYQYGYLEHSKWAVPCTN